MATQVALLRGINVGGKNSLPMQELRDILHALGCENVKTYIQSGNAVFTSDVDARRLAADIASTIEARAGFAPAVVVLSGPRFMSIADSNPYLRQGADSGSLHVWFFDQRPRNIDRAGMEADRKPTEAVEISAEALYLLAPEGIGRSKLASRIEKHLGVPSTARNWRTVCKIVEMMRQID